MILIRPTRSMLTINFYKPLLNKMGVEVTEIKDGVTEILAKNEQKRIPLQIPFGAYFWPAAILLYFTKSFSQIRLFTYYHLTITLIIPFLLLMPILNNIWSVIPVKTFRFLSEFLGLVFLLIGWNSINNIKEIRTVKND